MAKKAYHFTNIESAIKILESKRLKLSRFNDLNDPFELLHENIVRKTFRYEMQQQKEQFNKTHGVISFSKGYESPVQWAHYADRHKGVCLVFSVEDSLLNDVVYRKYKKLHTGILKNDIHQVIKFSEWSYEKEMRLTLSLNDEMVVKDGGAYFIQFNDAVFGKIKLTEIVFGANASDQDITEIYELMKNIKHTKVRPAFRKFKMTPKLNWDVKCTEK